MIFKQSFFKNFFIYSCVLLLSLKPELLAQNSKDPNFIFYITDDIGWNDLGAYGNTFVRTPNADKLAEEGAKFENFYLTTSSCSPSRSSIITGRYPHNTGAPELHDPLPREQVMFPELLKEAGYYTALSGKNHMGPNVKFAFDLVSGGAGPGGQEDWLSIIKERPSDKPFFFWFASHDAHRPWQFNGKGHIYDPDDIQVPPMLFDGPITRKDLAGYYHEISRADYYLGQIVDQLEKEDILDNTYIIFMSDNGSPFPRNKARLYDSGIKTFFIMSGPKVKKGIRNSLLSAIDIAPTILELAGVAPNGEIQGKSFDQILTKEKDHIRDFVFAEHNWHVFQAYERMVRYGDWLYIRNGYPERRNLSGESTRMFPAGEELWDAYEKGLTQPQQEDVFLKPRPAEELYNVKWDPFQFNNLLKSDNYEKIRNYLSLVLDQWVQETGDSKPTNPTPDRDDINANRLPGEWKRGERPGEKFDAVNINKAGPIFESDVSQNRLNRSNINGSIIIYN